MSDPSSKMVQLKNLLRLRFIRNYIWRTIVLFAIAFTLCFLLMKIDGTGDNIDSHVRRKIPKPVFIPATKAVAVPGLNIPLPIVYNISVRNKHVKYLPRDDNIKIPRIIHQTWKTRAIPKFNAKWVASWAKYNPHWQYYFWTDEAAAKFVKTKFPQYYDIYMKYERPIHRADVIRYLVLYYFGGVYADIDVEAVKSLDPLTRAHYSAVSQEPWVHSRLYWDVDRLPCNAIMASSTGHPFFKLLVESIPRNYYGNKLSDVMNKTGPMMVDRMLYEYEKFQSRKPYNSSYTVYLAEPDVFNPSYDQNQRSRLISVCDNPEGHLKKPEDIQRCKIERENGYVFKLPREAYTDHHWMHYWVGDRVFLDKIKDHDNIDIGQVIPHVVDASTLF